LGGTKTETSGGTKCPVWFKDVDKDGYTDGTTKVSCEQPDGYVPQALPGDCNDDDKNLNPNTVWFKDKDKDGYTDGTTKVSCTKPSDEYVLSASLLDCNDNDPNINSGKMEICDGKDNDCDGQTDEGFNVGQSCSVGLGECARTGQYVCRADGFGTECNARAGNPSLEICDGKDNDCNGQIDENLTRACYTGPAGTQGVGECKAGIQVCTNGLWGICQGQVLPQSEICDNKDNDCDGQIDEGFNVGQSCTVGVGECARTGQYVCKADGSGTQCNATPGTPTAEICDGRDNDCDGQIDEGIICVKVSAGSYHTCAIDNNGSLWCWGRNGSGQLGDGTYANKDAPVQVSGTNWASVSAGDGHTCGIKTDEILWCWGDNYYGQLGDGTYANKNTPVQVSGTNWVSVSAGWYHTCGVKTDRNLWCWGRNNYGQLGDGTNVGKNAPVQVSGTNWISVSAGDGHTCGVKTGGILWCWGDNYYGQLGDGTYANKNAPVQVSGTNWVSVSAGWYHTCGVKTDRTIWCWGRNNYGQLGDGTNVGKNVPVQVSGTNWVSVSAGGEHTCGIKTDGTIWCWGRNNYGQLGDGTYANKNAPVQVSGTNWVSVSAGKDHTCGIKTDGTIWCWGRNNYGQLGDGSLLFLDRNVPTLVCFSCAFYSYSLTTVPFSWDPSADPPSGNVAIVNNRDDVSFSLSLPFEFTFYGVTYTTLYIDSNGRLNFFANSSYYSNIPFPCSYNECKLVIAPLWDDWTTRPSGSEVRYAVVGSPPNRRLVVTWYGVSHYSSGGSFTFQAILYEGTNQILFQYHTISGTYSATIGVNRGDGIRHTSYTSSVTSGTALLFTPSSP
jgi:alpha-tubulin suppressor-like RCC1 family protein